MITLFVLKSNKDENKSMFRIFMSILLDSAYLIPLILDFLN
jgi:hypothetical protein